MRDERRPPVLAQARQPPVILTTGERRFEVILAIFGVTMLAAGVFVLYAFDPSLNGFYPGCLLYRSTGIECPGCGSLRALHQLLHGHLISAFRYNALLVLSLPVWTWLGVRLMLMLAGRQMAPLNVKPAVFWCILVIIVGFGVLRNL